MILALQDVSFSYGSTRIIDNATFQIEERDRVGLVGYNGCGKTTLLNVLMGSLSPDSGEISLKNGAVIGYLQQNSGLDPNGSVVSEMRSACNADELLERMKHLEHTMGDDPAQLEEYQTISERYEAIDGYHLDYQIKRLLLGMGFPEEDWNKRISVLSGGEKTRLSLARLLLQSPDLLYLDEPTNHLDLETLDWLEEYLKSYKGAILVVSHDRHFLDSVCNKTIQLQNRKTRTYNCGFSEYLIRREEDEKTEQAHYEQAKELKEKYLEYAERNMVRASTSNMAKSRLKMADRIELEEPDDLSHKYLKFEIIPDGDTYKDVLKFDNLSVGAGGKVLCSGMNLTLERGQRLAVIGRNGCGKTTLLKTIMGKQRPLAGRAVIGGGVRIGLQEQNLFNVQNENPLMYIWDRYPQMSQLEVRKLLALVGFRDEEVFTESRGLSGGELARLNMARLSLEHPNFLLLDEPTNHLDIFTKDILFDALSSYTGTLMLVSHDRWFIEKLGCRVLLMEDGRAELYENYAAFRDVAQQKRNAEQQQKNEKKENTPSQNQKELRRQKAEYRQRKSFLEKRIDELEKKQKSIENEISLPENASDSAKLTELCTDLDSVKNELSGLIDEYLLNYDD